MSSFHLETSVHEHLTPLKFCTPEGGMALEPWISQAQQRLRVVLQEHMHWSLTVMWPRVLYLNPVCKPVYKQLFINAVSNRLRGMVSF